MGGEWAETRVGNLLSFANGRSSPERADGLPYPVYGSNGIIGYASEANSDPGTIIIGRVGSYCGSLYQSPQKCWVTDNAIRAVAKNGNDPRFLYYLLGTLALNSRRAGSGQPLLNQDILSSIPTSAPEPTEQRAIAHILGTLDDKIELNRRRNQTLEAMARALFKDWFVDFGPVRAKMEGRARQDGARSGQPRTPQASDLPWPGAEAGAGAQGDPYLPADLWQLFPDRLDDEGKPEGWVQQRVGDIGAIICGKTPPTKKAEYYGDDVPFITIPEMHGNIFATDVKKRLSHHGAQSQQKKTLPPRSICVSCIATLGLVVITTEPSQTNQQINSVIPHQEDETYFWYWTLKNLGEEIKAGGSGGSVLGNLSTGRFSELRVNASSRPLRLAYNARVENLFSQILANELESQSLAQLRDTLLPKLISGELRIADAERFMEERAV
ncbi:restriction endonuclease subunit S [Thiorhodospira sibirica]|uniref:restriction endonuclease subunit S n=1 Tax=Thiorhodospira sibirica TaxID=154347 RepID=UPI00022C5DEB|nr:restriction endonuclease subunit S [Thiorhodospira sibirica]